MLLQPFESFDALIMINSSYATADPKSIVHMKYGTANDLTNTSIFPLYAKFAYHRADLQSSEMLHIDMFAPRFDRIRILLIQGSLLSTPRELRDYWGKSAMDAYARSKAFIVLNLGAHAGRPYERYLKSSGFTYTGIPMARSYKRTALPVW